MTELTPDARSLVNASRAGEAPSPETRRRLRAMIAVTTGCAAAVAADSLPASASASPPAAMASGATAGGAKLVIALALATTVGFGGGWLAGRAPAARSPGVSLVAVPIVIADPPAAPPRDPQPTPAPVTLEAPAPAPPGHQAVVAFRRVAPRVTVTANPRSSLLAELELMRSASDALSRDAEHALALLEEHASQYPRGELEQERESLRVLALCGLDRVAEAKQVADAFLARWPDSPHAGRLSSSCVARAHE